MEKFLEVLPDKPSLIQRALALTLEKLQAAIDERGQCTLALSGGSTPKPLYEAMANQDFPWEKLHIFWGDERYVSPDHPDSNQRMARQAWLNRVPIPAENIHPMPTEGESAMADAMAYEQDITHFFDTSAATFPRFDLILLGMGDDGHTASLFPKTEALSVRDRLITVGEKDTQPRLTFTVPLLNQARCVLFLVAGNNKCPALAQVFASEADSSLYPSRLIQPKGEMWWLLDAAAGSQLSPPISS